jgi:hypothetical protein
MEDEIEPQDPPIKTPEDFENLLEFLKTQKQNV